MRDESFGDLLMSAAATWKRIHDLPDLKNNPHRGRIAQHQRRLERDIKAALDNFVVDGAEFMHQVGEATA